MDFVQLAIDINERRIFTDKHLRDSNLLKFCFPTACTQERIDEYEKNPIGLIYEYLDKAQKRSYNGFPVFLTYNTLTVEETELLYAEMDKLPQPSPISQEARKRISEIIDQCINHFNGQWLGNVKETSYKHGVKISVGKNCFVDYNWNTGEFKSPYLKKMGIKLE